MMCSVKMRNTLLVILVIVQVLGALPQCLVQQSPPTSQCLQKLDLQSLLSESPELISYLCPIMVKQGTLEKGEQFCNWCTQNLRKDTISAYMLIEIYLKTNQYRRAMQTEYQIFWKRPFNHQKKLADVLERVEEHIQSWIQAQANQQNIDTVIALTYTKKYQKALTILNKISKELIQPLNSQEWTFLPILLKIRLMDKNGEFPQALDYVNQHLSIAQQSDNKTLKQLTWFLYHNQGNLYMHHIKFNEAIKSFQKSIQKFSHASRDPLFKFGKPAIFHFSLYNLAISLQKKQKYQQSITYLKTLIQNKQSVEVGQVCYDCYNALGFAYYTIGGKLQDGSAQQNKSYGRADKYYEIAEKYQDQDVYTATFNRAILYYSQQKYKQALNKFKLALKINANLYEAHYGILKSMYKINTQQGLEYVQQLKKTPKANLFELAQILYELGDATKCLELLNEHVNNIMGSQKSMSNKESSHLYSWKGLIQYELQLYKQAKQSLRLAISFSNTEAEVQEALGDIYSIQRSDITQLQKSIYYYKKAIQKFETRKQSQKVKQLKKTIKTIEKQIKTNQQL